MVKKLTMEVEEVVALLSVLIGRVADMEDCEREDIEDWSVLDFVEHFCGLGKGVTFNLTLYGIKE